MRIVSTKNDEKPIPNRIPVINRRMFVLSYLVNSWVNPSITKGNIIKIATPIVGFQNQNNAKQIIIPASSPEQRAQIGN